ncbi:MAG: flippase [Candidatus Omnitrophica bacterium]|nr:flippase [Candidatus Omnitrophota bacterium]MDD5679799.1 flippase [Candidatus Omnitrophota bacterium]
MEKLSKNFTWLGAANIVSSIFGTILFIYLARVLGPDAFGYFSYALTIMFFLANFVDMGLSTYGIREVAKNSRRVPEYASEIVSFRFVAASILFFLVVIVTSLSSHSAILKSAIILTSLMLFTFSLATEWAFQGVEKMGMVFLSFAVTSILQLGLTYLFVKKPSDLLRAPVIYFVSTLPVVITYLKILKFRVLLKMDDLKKMLSYLSSSLVIWSISIFAQVYNGLDIFILGLFRPIQEVGYFTIARRVVGAVILFMIFLTNAVLPRLSYALCNDPAVFRDTTRKFLKLGAILTAFVLLPGIFVCEKAVIFAVGNEYVPAVVPLNIMIVGLVFVLFNLPYSTGLIACGMEKDVMIQTAASAALSLLINFIIIPKYGMIGASVSFTIVEIFAFVWIFWIYEAKTRHVAVEK